MRIIPAHRKYRHKRPVHVHGAAIDAAERTFSAARLSDILRGSYRLSPQSPASSQYPAGIFCHCMAGPAQAFLVYITSWKLSRGISLFFIKIFSVFCELCLPPGWLGRCTAETRRRSGNSAAGFLRKVLLNQRVRIDEKIFCPARQKIAGILDVFQDFLTKWDEKFSGKTCAGIYSELP